MAKTGYIKRKDADFLAQMKAFRTNINQYSGSLNINGQLISEQAADTGYLEYILACQSVTQNSAAQWSAWKDILRGGGVLPTSGSPVPPAFPGTVNTVTPGIEVRFRSFAQVLKAHANYNTAIGE